MICASCSGSGAPRDNPLLAGGAPMPVGVQAGCDIAAVKCTRCHTIDRLLRARPSSPVGWERYVARMRLMPGAGISESDEDQILQCLVFRSFGDDGLRALSEAGR